MVAEMCTAGNCATENRHDRSISSRTESSYVHDNPLHRSQVDTYTTVRPCILHRCNRSPHCGYTSLDRNWHRCKDRHRRTARQHHCRQADSLHGSRTNLVVRHIGLEHRRVTCKESLFVLPARQSAAPNPVRHVQVEVDSLHVPPLKHASPFEPQVAASCNTEVRA